MSNSLPIHLDFAALMCSRLCHDLVGPIGAVANGAELLAEGEQDMLDDATSLISNSAGQAVRRLRFYRIAFGASGAASIGWAEALQTTSALLEDHKTELKLDGDGIPGEGGESQGILIKVVLNAILMVSAGIPRGGDMLVRLRGDQSAPQIAIEATGSIAKMEENGLEALQIGQSGAADLQGIDARAAQPFLLGQLAGTAGLVVAVGENGPERLNVEIRPAS